MSGFTARLACLVLLSGCQAPTTGAPDGAAETDAALDAAEGSDTAGATSLDGGVLAFDESAGEVASPSDLTAPLADDGPAPAPALDGVAVRALLTRVAHYQLDHGASDNDWEVSTFYVGLMAAQRATGDDGLRQAAQKWGASHGWHLHAGSPRFADDQVCTQTYLELYLAQPAGNAAWIASTRGAFDEMVAHPRAGHVEWSWCDALFMAAPALARLGAATGGKAYFALLDDMFFDSEKALFSQADGLIWRDHHDVGSKTFWGRGNGWVIAAVARVLDVLPMDDPKRADYEALLATMAGALAKAQGSDGAWRADLLHPQQFPNPEMSGTGLITFGIAWGVVHGVLPRAQFLPVAVNGWASLVSHVDAAGRLGYVQENGHDPAAAQAGQSFPYGAGALLLAGEQMLKL